MAGYLLDTNHLSRLIDQRFSILTTDNDFSAVPGLARENWLAVP